ncbi:MAG: hypothetical protein PVH30_10660 [Desulfobacterales bacterium]|jgi:hypothetical protein
MTLLAKFGRFAPRIGILLAASLILTGCAGIEPFEPRNHREEGPEKGLFTGSDGEFTILRKAETPETTGEEVDEDAAAVGSDVAPASAEEASEVEP